MRADCFEYQALNRRSGCSGRWDSAHEQSVARERIGYKQGGPRDGGHGQGKQGVTSDGKSVRTGSARDSGRGQRELTRGRGEGGTRT